MKKIVLFSALLAVAVSSYGADDAIMAKYNQSCAVCHASGMAGAPATGSVDDWAPRLEKGMDALVVSATNGVGAMPPKGMCNDCTAEDYQALITYMSTAE